MNESITKAVKYFTVCASLAANGVKVRQLDLFNPIRQCVRIAQKTVKPMPINKLYDVFFSMLARAHELVEINTRLRGDPALHVAFGRSRCAEQSVVQETMDSRTPENLRQMEQALDSIYHQQSQGYQHDYPADWQILDVGMSVLPCGPKAAFVSKGCFAKQRNRRGRQLDRVLVTRYLETFFSSLNCSRMIVLLLLVVLIVTIPLTVFIARKEPNSQQHVAEATLPPDGQGLYESCQPSEGVVCLDHLKTMGASGFKLVVNYDQMYGSADQEIVYANQANTVGMKVIWAMNDPAFWDGTDLRSHFNKVGATCNCSDNTGFIKYFITLVKNLPGTWGYYVGDEVDPSNYGKLKAFTYLVKQTDPVHPRLFVGCGQCENSGPSYTEALIPMVDTTDVVGLDYYPVGADYVPIANTGKAANAVQTVAKQDRKDSAMVLQSFSFAEYKEHTCSLWPSCALFPTYDQMRLMRDLTLRNSHPRLILWYSYFDILKSDNPSAHWADLVAAAGANLTSNSSTTSKMPSTPYHIDPLFLISTIISSVTINLPHQASSFLYLFFFLYFHPRHSSGRVRIIRCL